MTSHPVRSGLQGHPRVAGGAVTKLIRMAIEGARRLDKCLLTLGWPSARFEHVLVVMAFPRRPSPAPQAAGSMPRLRPNQLPARYKRRLARAGISHDRIADESWRFRPGSVPVRRQFVSAVLNGRSACPEWFRRQLDEILAEAVAQKAPAERIGA